MSRYPWRNTSEDIAKEAESQWETPGGAQEKADQAETNAKTYSDQKLNAHIGTGGSAHANVIAGGAAGFMTGADKTKLDGVATGANNYVHPATHPPSIIAQDANNRFVTDAEKSTWNSKAPSTLATTSNDGLMPASDKTKLNGIATGAEVNQNAFAKVNDVTASAKSDTLQIAGGTGITISTDPAGKKVMVTATGTATPGPHASSHITGGTDVIPNAVTNGSSGLMSGTDAQFVRIEGETKSGAQSKADAALVSANGYTDTAVSGLAATVASKTQDATTTQKGITQLSSATNGTRNTVAATEGALKAAYDLANAALPKGGGVLTGDITLSKSSPRMTFDNTAASSDIVLLESGSGSFAVQQVAGSTTTNLFSVNTAGEVTIYDASGNVAYVLQTTLASLLATAANILSGSGSPEGSVTATVGKLYLRTNGGANTTLYVKESGTGNTGWVAK